MKILDEKLSQKFNDTYCTKKVTVLHENDSDIDFCKPYTCTYIALYRKDKLLGFVAGTTRYSLVIPKLFKIRLIGRNAKFGVFNVNTGKMVYRGNEEPSLNENGFEVTKVVKIKSHFNFKGELEYSQTNESNKKIYNDIF